ncbi:MAG TPA: ATP-binding protein [Hyphomicrobium sp.]|jgi:predicted ATP-dependent protease
MFFKRARQDKKKSSESQAEAQSEGANGSPVPGAPEALQARAAIDPKSLGFATTAEIEPALGPVGQARALEQLAFGAGMKGPGYNILVTGGDESGCRAAVRAKLEELAREGARPADWICVGYFDPGGGYRALKLAPGQATKFAEAMAGAIDRLADALPAAFAADDYELKRRAIEEEFRFSREDALEALRREAEAQNIALLRTPAGIAVAPIFDGRVVKAEVFNSVPEELRREVQAKIAALEAEIEQVLAERPGAEKARRERLLALNEQIAGRQVRSALEDVMSLFADVAGMERYLKAAGRDLVRNAGIFLSIGGHESVKVPVGTLGDARLARYRVHVLATSEEGAHAPIVEETNPTYANLFGHIKLGSAGGGQPSQVSRIKPGALHRANGGFLLLDARALLAAPAVTEALARALETQEIRFDPPTDPVGVGSGEIPDLEPIPLNVKLVVLGDADAVRQLARAAPQLKRQLKVEAIFDEEVERSAETVAAYARLIAGIVAENELKPVDVGGVAKLIEEAARKAGGNGKLSLRVGHIADLCREADHWAKSAGRNITSGEDVERALKERGSATLQAGEGSAP